MHFSEADTDEDIRRQLVLAFFGPDVPVDVQIDEEVRLAFEAMVRKRASVEDGIQRTRKRHLRLVQ